MNLDLIDVKCSSQSIPTLIFFDHGREIKRFVGVQSTETLEKYVDDVLIKKS